jgi:hypothetical protein
MTDSSPAVSAGPYVAGEKPAPLTYTFLDSTGAPLDLSGYTAKFIVRERFGAPTTYDAVVTTPASGIVTYTWTGAEFPTSGQYTAEVWAGNGVLRYDSVLIKFDVRTAVGPVPSI